MRIIILYYINPFGLTKVSRNDPVFRISRQEVLNVLNNSLDVRSVTTVIQSHRNRKRSGITPGSKEATTRIELVIRVLQTLALPLGYVAVTTSRMDASMKRSDACVRNRFRRSRYGATAPDRENTKYFRDRHSASVQNLVLRVLSLLKVTRTGIEPVLPP